MFQLFIKNGEGYGQLEIEGDGGLILETNNPLEYEFGKTHKTYSITIFNIGNNNILLDNLFYRSYKHVDLYKDIYYKIDESVYLKGVLKILNFNERFAKAQFISYDSILWNRLKNTKLNEIDYVTQSNTSIDITPTTNTLADSESLNYYDGEVIWDLVDRGRTREHQILNYRRSYIDVAERFPAIKMSTIINNIFKDFNISGNFVDTVIYDKMYLLYTGKNSLISNDRSFEITNSAVLGKNDEYNLSQEIPSTYYPEEDDGGIIIPERWEYDWDITEDILFNNVIDDNAGGYDDGHYTIQQAGVYEFNYDIKFNLDIVNEISAETGTFISFRVYNQSNTTIYIYDEQFIRNGKDTYTIKTPARYFDVGDEIKIEFNLNREYTSFFTSLDPFTLNFTIEEDSEFHVIASTGQGENQDAVNISRYLSDIKVTDFIKYLLREFNIELFVSQEKEEVVLNKRQFNENAIDLSRYIIADTINVDLNPDRANWQFMHKIDSADAIMSAYYKELEEQLNGDYNFNIDSQFNNIFESDFSMCIEEPIAKYGISSNNLKLYNDIDGDKFTTDFNYRLVFDAGTDSCDYELVTFGGNVNRSSYRKLSTIIPEFNYKFNGDLFNNFHRNNINNITFGYTIELEMILPATVISNFYNLENNYWLNSFYINTPVAKGYFVLIQLNNIEGDIYKGKFYYIVDVETLGEFSDDFYDDFNI